MRIKNYFNKYYDNTVIINNHEVMNIIENSKEATQNSVFVALKGHHDKGVNFINEAIARGAKTIIYDDDNYLIEDDLVNIDKINFVKVVNARIELARLLAWYYHKRTMPKIIAVTGTNGKTTVTTNVFNVLRKLNINVLLLGTEENILYYDGHTSYRKAINTTPAISYIYKMALEHPYKYLVMEASSQGISEMRLLGLKYQIVCFTNITQDHLDYHKTMDRYAFTKARLIYDLDEDGILILNHKMAYFDELSKLSLNKTITYSSDNDNAVIQGTIINQSLKNMEIMIKNANNEYHLRTKIIGAFNLDNILATYSILKCLKIDDDLICHSLRKIEAVKGRMNIFKLDNKYLVVDFAHTPDGVKQVLNYFNKVKKKNLITVIGCGGSRDHTKRPIMGKIATSLSDLVIFTEDNSRDEEVLDIISEITNDLQSQNYLIEENREKAINLAISHAQENDIICILGKGSEEYIIGKKIRKFSDIDFVKKLGGKSL